MQICLSAVIAARIAPLLAALHRVGDLGDELVEHGLVEADLLGGHRAVVELVDLVRELGGDLGLALGAPEQQDPVERPQGGLAVAGHLGDERRPRPDEARIGEVEDRPEVADAVLDRRAGQRQPRASGDAPQLLGGLAGRVLDRLRLVEHDRGPLDGGQRLDVAHGGGVGGDHDVGLGDLLLELRVAGASAP